jgi:tRNA pseudouridine38-40 synthase
MRYFKMTLAYDGGAYAGWQVQADRDTVQARLQRALQTIVGQPVTVIGSGRTDAGVHALGQVASFCCECQLSEQVLQRALNGNLPADIVVLDLERASDGFHAIRDAVSKRYRYVIQDGPTRDIFVRHYCWHIPRVLDQPAMQRAAMCLLGTHDFAGFQAAGSQRATTERTISEIVVDSREQDGLRRIVIEVEADGFLYNMVRNIVGSLVEVGRGGQSEAWFADLLEHGDRRLAGPTAPPQGLFLVHVKY